MPATVRVTVDKSATLLKIRLESGEHDGEPSELLYDILMQYARREEGDDGKYEIMDSHRRFATTLCKQMDKAIFMGRA